jgi:hypothetical protein
LGIKDKILMSKTLPDFLIVGVARCGTTSLFHYLSQHPELEASRLKEPKYFSSASAKNRNGPGDSLINLSEVKTQEDYLRLWSDSNRLKFEASSDYFYHFNVTISRIKSEIGDIPIIIALRNPKERSFSSYMNLVRDSREHLAFEKALEMESDRIEAGYDWMWHYSTGSFYSEGVNSFLNNFSNVHIVLFENLSMSPKQTLKEICTFLNVDNSFNFDTNIKFSQSGKAKNILIKTLTKRDGLLGYIRLLVLKFIPRSLLQKISSDWFDKESTPPFPSTISNEFNKDISKLEDLLKRDLTHWKI